MCNVKDTGFGPLYVTVHSHRADIVIRIWYFTWGYGLKLLLNANAKKLRVYIMDWMVVTSM